jgi:5S rRNA maturation endonuclease (ribonuclease M5)
MKTVETLAEAVDLAKRGEQTMCKCPAHNDGTASLHVAPGTEQPVVMRCHAGCEVRDILAEGGVNLSDILAEEDGRVAAGTKVWTPAGPASHVYPYCDESGELLFEVLRVPQDGGDKTFRQRHPNPNFGVEGHPDAKKPYLWTMNGVRRVLYRLPEVLEAKAEGKTIYVVEGEKDVESLRARGYTATTSPMGAGKWQPEYTEMLAGAVVVIIPDADATGRAHARAVRDELVAAGCMVTTKEAATGHKDISDHFRAGLDMDALIETVPEKDDKRESYGVDVLSIIKRTVSKTSYVIPDILARGDRLLVTGFEGHGKSTFLRQMAVQCAMGIHPFSGKDMDPQKVLFFDVENHPDQVLESWQQLIGLGRRHGFEMEPGRLTVLEEWDNDIDLTVESGYAWMIERIHAYRPDLVFMGPLYNMANRDLKDDETVRKIKKVVNDARGICGTAFVMEHHAPHRNPADKERSVRPYGSSTFLKWPDFGYGLKPLEQEGVYEWQKTRFPRVRSRKFPTHLRWGKANSLEWPWMPAAEDANGIIQ